MNKRIFDILVSSLLLIMISPILVAVIIAMKLESRGPIFYVSRRVGQGYNIFKLYKFRTMYMDADKRLDDLKHLNQYADQDHPRIEIRREHRLHVDRARVHDDALDPDFQDDAAEQMHDRVANTGGA